MYQIFDPHFWLDRVSSTRLVSRGWVFQERALAPRVLHFGFDQVLWECAEAERAEEFPFEIPHRFIDFGLRGFKEQLSTDIPQDPTANNDANLLHDQHRVLNSKWAKAIENYTRCELTKAEDKLVAISGVVQVLADCFNDEYVAGLWRSNLVGGLCWQVAKIRLSTQELIPSGLYARRFEISRRPTEYLAPPWSWASVDGEITAGPFLLQDKAFFSNGKIEGDYIMRSLVGELDVDSTPITDMDASGEIVRTEMRLTGTLYQLRASSTKYEGIVFHYAGSSERAEVCLDQPEEVHNVEEAYLLPLLHCWIETAPTSAPEPRAERPVAESSVAKLKRKGKAILKKKSAVESLPDKQTAVQANDTNTASKPLDTSSVPGIVLVRTESSETYRRIGFHECEMSVLENLRSKSDEGWREGRFILV